MYYILYIPLTLLSAGSFISFLICKDAKFYKPSELWEIVFQVLSGDKRLELEHEKRLQFISGCVSVERMGKLTKGFKVNELLRRDRRIGRLVIYHVDFKKKVVLEVFRK